MTRCEPPAEMREREGLHILLTPSGEEDAGKWRGPDMEWWFGGHVSMSAVAAAEIGWRYLGPIPSHAEIEALVKAARSALEWQQRRTSGLVATAHSTIDDLVEADLAAALSHFPEEARDGG